MSSSAILLRFSILLYRQDGGKQKYLGKNINF